MEQPAKWIADVYLHGDLDRDKVFTLVKEEGLGRASHLYDIDGEDIELSVRRNPDKTGNSPFGLVRVMIEVAKPPGVSVQGFETAYHSLLKLLDRHGITYDSAERPKIVDSDDKA
jgi:hypothetical protein